MSQKTRMFLVRSLRGLRFDRVLQYFTQPQDLTYDAADTILDMFPNGTAVGLEYVTRIGGKRTASYWLATVKLPGLSTDEQSLVKASSQKLLLAKCARLADRV